jgi:transcriptional regulator with XRE-family HTH domain
MGTIKLKIAELRKEKGSTQAELAEFLGVSFQSVSKWENGTTMPDITFLPNLAEYFEISVDELLGLKP